MTLKDMISLLSTIQFERIEIRDDAGNELFTGSRDDFTVYVRKSVDGAGKSVQPND